MTGSNNHQYGKKGTNNASFTGQIIEKKNGKLVDKFIYLPDHPFRNKSGRVKYHRYLVEENYTQFDTKYFTEIKGKYYLKKDIVVHHKNFDHDDNSISNLEPLTKSEHSKIHSKNITIVRDSKGKIVNWHR